MIDRILRNAYGVDAKNAKTAKGRKAFALLCALCVLCVITRWDKSCQSC